MHKYIYSHLSVHTSYKDVVLLFLILLPVVQNVILANFDVLVSHLPKLAKMMFLGQETVRKQTIQGHLFMGYS